MEDEKILINGSMLEGGGQILRISLSCSSIFNIFVTIENIRGNRSKPGLQNQHLTGVKLLAKICSAIVTGDALQSVFLSFCPKSISAGCFEANCQTAGSVCLIMQAIIPTLIFAKESSILSLVGGTDVEFAPTINYYEEIVQFYMAKMGIEISIDLERRGFYPRGGGKVKIEIESVKDCIKPINMTDQGEITSLKVVCFVAGTLPLSLAKDMFVSFDKTIKSHSNYRHVKLLSNIYKETSQKANGNGSGCILIVETSTGCRFGFNIIGKREFSGSYMGENVARQFIDFFEYSKACVDTQMQDQILLLMALAKGLSKIRCSALTLHSQTCIYVLEKMIGIRIFHEKLENSEDVILSCEGLESIRK